MRATFSFGLALCALAAPATAGDELLKLVADDAGFNESIGAAVAIQGSTALVGCPDDGDNGAHSGSVYVFDALTGRQLDKLLPLNGTAGHRFGAHLALDGDVALVSGLLGGTGLFPGSAYLFDLGTGQQTAQLTPSDSTLGDLFGRALALSDDRALVGAPHNDSMGQVAGAAFVFDAQSGDELLRLMPSDAGTNRVFGWSVALDGPTALIGALGGDWPADGCGAVYVFDAASGAELRKLTPSDGPCTEQYGRQFGYSVDLDGGLAVIGAAYDGSNGELAGSAYVFDVASGAQLLKLTSGDDWTTGFGRSVAIQRGTAVVGGTLHEGGTSVGVVYLFDITTGERIGTRRIEGADLSAFGESVGLSGTSAVAGDTTHVEGGVLTGAAFVFDVSQAIAVPYCFGGGAGTPCPCGNAGAAGHGCANGANAEGARLDAVGTPCVTEDELVLSVTGSAPGQAGVFFQGDQALGRGAGVAFGDGLRCAGGNALRLELAGADASGTVSSTVALAANAGLEGGDVRRYQWWYRDPAASPCGNGFNLSNGLEIAWGQ